ncbi:MAG: hypothetical protein HY077_08805 [Elusimicrobia bacterium]|nr:hypothetical protein [Elusimicrobiota bacterium]
MDTAIKDLHPQDRPKAKLTRLSPEALTDKELLALILGKGHATDKTMEQAGKILSSFPSGLKSLSFEVLQRIKGLSVNGAATLAAAYELAKRDNSKDYRPVLDSPSRVAEHIPAEVRSGRKEHFIALYLNARSQLIKFESPAIAVVDREVEYLKKAVIPVGTKVIGTVSIQQTHDRALIIFHTIVFPEGDEMKFSGMALSLDGSAGIKGKVETHKDSSVANTVLKSVVTGTQGALMFSGVSPIAAGATQGLSNEATKELDLQRQEVTTSISVDAETGLKVYLPQRIEY